MSFGLDQGALAREREPHREPEGVRDALRGLPLLIGLILVVCSLVLVVLLM